MLISLDLCFELIYSKIKFCNLADTLKNQLFYETKVFVGNIEKKGFEGVKKRHLFYIHRFINKSSLFIENLTLGEKDYVDVETVMSKFIQANYEFSISKKECQEIFSEYFTQNEETIATESINNFTKNHYFFKINLMNSIDILIKELILVFRNLESKLGILYDQYDSDCEGIIQFKHFDNLMKQILKSDDYWRTADYFK